MQNDTSLWLIAEDGSITKEVELDLDCTSCSNLVKIENSTYVVLADMGLYEVQFDFKNLSEEAVPKMTGSPRRVFLSHASEDKVAVVQPFYKECERKGVSAWLDAAQIQWGDPLVKKIEQGIGKSDVVLLFLSEDFLKKPWPLKELETALSLEINGRKAVLPLVLGLSHERLEAEHPFIASKLYRCIETYDPAVQVTGELIQELVNDLETVLATL